jgi:hypothetical protein
MALVSSDRRDVGRQLQELLEQLNNLEEQEMMLTELRESVKAFEQRYGMQSHCVHDAIESGELVEDRDVAHWIFQYDLLRSVEEK